MQNCQVWLLINRTISVQPNERLNRKWSLQYMGDFNFYLTGSVAGVFYSIRVQVIICWSVGHFNSDTSYFYQQNANNVNNIIQIQSFPSAKKKNDSSLSVIIVCDASKLPAIFFRSTRVKMLLYTFLLPPLYFFVFLFFLLLTIFLWWTITVDYIPLRSISFLSHVIAAMEKTFL